LPAPVDPRQLSLLGAGWTLGSIHQLAAAGADALTYYELAGWRGVLEWRGGLTRQHLFPSRPGQLFPLYHVFAALAEFSGGQIATVTLADGLSTEALAVRQGDRVRVLVASFGEDERIVSVSVPHLRDAIVRALDETTYDAAGDDPAFFTQSGETLSVTDGQFELTLRPFAVACIDGRV
jgi:D-apionolactonase